MKDDNGLEITTLSEEVIEAAQEFRSNLLSMGKDTGNILTHADNNLSSPLLQSYAGFVWLSGQTEHSGIEAKKYLDQAETVIEKANEREKLFYSALKSWQSGKINDAASKLEYLISNWPKDLVAVKILEFLYYQLGQEYSGPRFLKCMEGIYDINRDSGFFLANYSFAQELCGNYEEAEFAANRAVELVELNPWAHHTLSHVYLKKGEITSGTKILEDYKYIWDKSGQAIHSHNYWHLALMYLEELEREKAFSFLDNYILKERPYLVIQLLDATSLLWRLEMAGFDVKPDCWKKIGKEVSKDVKDCRIGFNTAHYVYALTRAGMKNELNEVTKSVDRYVSNLEGSEYGAWKIAGIPLVNAAEAFADGNYGKAVELFAPAIDKVTVVGGSDAQDDLFRQMYLLSLIKSGKKSESLEYLNTISTSEKLTPLQQYWNSLI